MISASILSSDFLNLERDISQLINLGINMLHFDVMDGHFVSNITFGNFVGQQIRNTFPDIYIQSHLMISNPEKHIQKFCDLGSNEIMFHIEVEGNHLELIEYIQKRGIKAGIAINPDTPVDSILSIIHKIDSVLIMTVVPGKGGQEFIDCSDKIKHLKSIRKDILITVDGGINDKTGALCKAAGADILVSGSYLFSNLEENSKKLLSI